MKRARFVCEVVGSIPESLMHNTLYVTVDRDVAGHLCACGCGREVITPLSPTDWQLSFDRKGATLSPSIGNWSFPCRSHYFIRGGAVLWSYDMSDEAVELGRRHYKARKERHYIQHESYPQAQLERQSQPPAHARSPSAPTTWQPMHRRILAWLARLFSG